jgi:Protein of unknown function (DUF3047)
MRAGSMAQRRTRMTRKRRIIALSLLTLFLTVRTAWPSEAGPSRVVIDFNNTGEHNGVPRPWHAKLRGGNAEAVVVPENGSNVLRIKCDDASFSVERDVAISAGEFPVLIWEWKAAKLPSRGDVRRSSRNDQGLQVLLAFDNRKVISYIWDSGAPVGTVVDESVGWPFSIAVKAVVVESGEADLGKWVVQQRNIYKDYERLFHEKPSRLAGVRLQANTQYTKDSSEGFIRHIIFSRAAPD